MPNQFSTACLLVAYRPDLGQLTGRWLRSVSEDELREGYAALHYACGRWLVDARRRVTRSLSGPEWVTSQFLPEVQQALGQPLRVCFLVLPDYLAGLSIVAHLSGSTQFSRFVDEGAATPWLAAG